MNPCNTKNALNISNSFFCSLFSKILGAIDIASKYLQNKKPDLSLATLHLENALQMTKIYRLSFSEAKQEAIATASKWGGEVKFKDKRI